ncbi:(2Fe-2S) ferredoxin domain-containing protein [Candidatus Woesearchaeota archaeon]|nr:(2Fe-2S) ferredoxin domain-containing protein [Candidatus Woesearchaeota archaeon]
MKQIKNMNYKVHVLVCVNKRENSPTPCCADVHGQEIYDQIKKFVKDQGLTGIVWVTRTRCLGFCNTQGTTVVFYPERVWLTEVKLNEVPKLIEYITLRAL